MELAVLGLLAQVFDTGANLFNEAQTRRKSTENKRLFEAVRGLDAKLIAKVIEPTQLFMRSATGISAEQVVPVLERPEVEALAQELFLVSLVEPDESPKLRMVSDSLGICIGQHLCDVADSKVATEYGDRISKDMVTLCRATASQLSAAHPELSVQIEQTALLRQIASILDVIGPNHSAIERLYTAHGVQERAAFISRYRKLCAERHGYITPPDFETNRKIPIGDLYVAPELVKGVVREYHAPLQVEEFIRLLNRTVVLGDPGGGKSTLSNFIVSLLAGDLEQRVPFHVTLRDFASREDGMSLLQFIEYELKPRYQIAPVAGVVEDLLLTGKAFVVFDGLDELIDATKRREITKSVELFGISYPHTPILVTSRRVGYEQARLDPAIFETFSIGGFKEHEVNSYVHKWFESQDEYTTETAQVEARAFVEQSAAVPDLRSNPLMLALMCIIFRGENYIPRNRPAVYEKCANLLFEKWDGHRGIEVPLQAKDHVDPAMKFIAYEFMTSGYGDSGVPRRQVVRMLAEYLYGRAVESPEQAHKAADEFVDYCAGRAWVFTDAGTTREGEPIFTFTHRTFMEYFAAVHLTRISDTPEKLAVQLLPKIAREEWDVVSELAVQQINESTDQGTMRILAAMLNDRRKRTFENRGRILAFVARCLKFAIVPPALQREIARAAAEYTFAGPSLPKAFGKDPLSLLRQNTAKDQAALAASEVEEVIESQVALPPKRRQLVSLIYSWLFDASLVGAGAFRYDNAWTGLAIRFARKHYDLLLENIEPRSVLPFLLGWQGEFEQEQTLEMMRSSTPEFVMRYFGSPTYSDGRGIIGSPISEWYIFILESGLEGATEPQLRFLKALSEAIVEDFFSELRHLPKQESVRRRLRMTRFQFFFFNSHSVNDLGSDALLICALGLAELQVLDLGEAEAERIHELIRSHWKDVDTGELLGPARKAASQRLQSFVEKWLLNQEQVFSR